jgi:dihydroxyacid dehydratase/phosphogluconate dehydratase
MSTVPELMHRNLLGVFGERDAAHRASAIADTHTQDVVFADPEGTVTGRDALGAKAQALLDGAPGFVFAPRGDVRESGGTLGLLAWQFGPEGGEPVATGTDIALVRDGRIATLHTLLDA